MSIEIRTEDGGIMTSLLVTARTWDHQVEIAVRAGARCIGSLTVSEADAPAIMARLLGPKGHDAMCGTKTILERCVSLVQSMAERPLTGGLVQASERLDVLEAEAYRIARDAGWET